jgi:hypothetical protein
MENKIKAEIVAHSKRANTGEEIITYKLTFPRIILSETNTYGSLSSRSTSSSRAVPFDKMVEVVEKEPFVPLAFQKQHRGMQGNSYLTDPKIIQAKIERWLEARDNAIISAKLLYGDEKFKVTYADGGFDIKDIPGTGVTKQLANRLLENWMWVTQLVTGYRESFEHLFDQRCPQYEFYFGKFKSKKDVLEYLRIGEIEYPKPFPETDLDWLKCNKGQAEIHFMDLSEKMYDALNESTPDVLKEGEWHIPFQEEIWKGKQAERLEDFIKMSCAMAARTSYTTIADNEILTLEKAKKIYNKCVEQGHFSVVSHCAKCMTDDEYESWIKGKLTQVCFSEFDNEFFLEARSNKEKGWNKNIRGFVSLRQYVEDGTEITN